MSKVAPQLNKWKAWGNENLRYLMVKRDLFGMPLRKDGIDGSAHIIGDRGYLFLFNPTEKPHAASIPLDSKIMLTQGSVYRIDMLYPHEICYGSLDRGESFSILIPPRSAYLLAISPYHGNGLPTVKLGGGIDVQSAFEVGYAH